MHSGFIFNNNLCVGCRACSVACILENSWTIHPRNIYTFNSEALAVFPLINLSLACNHCENPVCLEGCPSGAFSKDKSTGAVIISGEKCIGCKYCQWNCPYDSPKYQLIKGVMEKCHMCNEGLSEGRLPACASGCPTGALDFGTITDSLPKFNPEWFPDKNLNPSIEFSGDLQAPLRIIPENSFEADSTEINQTERIIYVEWSLVAFTFLTVLSVSNAITSALKGIFPELISIILLVSLPFVFSLFHLGKASRAWRAVANIRSSPLSREITLYIVFSGLSVIAVFLKHPLLIIISSVTGILLLIAIDSVYVYSDKSKKVFLHSGQAFISSLIIISYFTGNVLPFVFISFLKIASILYLQDLKSRKGLQFVFRFVRLVFLLIPTAFFIIENTNSNIVITILFLTGELFDRVIYYCDFNPMNIKNLITKTDTLKR